MKSGSTEPAPPLGAPALAATETSPAPPTPSRQTMPLVPTSFGFASRVRCTHPRAPVDFSTHFDALEPTAVGSRVRDTVRLYLERLSFGRNRRPRSSRATCF